MVPPRGNLQKFTTPLLLSAVTVRAARIWTILPGAYQAWVWPVYGDGSPGPMCLHDCTAISLSNSSPNASLTAPCEAIRTNVHSEF